MDGRNRGIGHTVGTENFDRTGTRELQNVTILPFFQKISKEVSFNKYLNVPSEFELLLVDGWCPSQRERGSDVGDVSLSNFKV